MKLDVGCGLEKRPGFVGIDRLSHPSIDINHDLSRFPWPIADNSVAEVQMHQVLEHLSDTVATFNELHRILKPDGRAVISYPWYRSFGAFSDPTHVHYFNDGLIDYFVEERLGARYGYTDRFFAVEDLRLTTYSFLSWLPNRALKFISRHFGLDVVHSVILVVRPKK